MERPWKTFEEGSLKEMCGVYMWGGCGCMGCTRSRQLGEAMRAELAGSCMVNLSFYRGQIGSCCENKAGTEMTTIRR
jgi:hypothetical protein